MVPQQLRSFMKKNKEEGEQENVEGAQEPEGGATQAYVPKKKFTQMTDEEFNDSYSDLYKPNRDAEQ